VAGKEAADDRVEASLLHRAFTSAPPRPRGDPGGFSERGPLRDDGSLPATMRRQRPDPAEETRPVLLRCLARRMLGGLFRL
jgi:hypothetical protein